MVDLHLFDLRRKLGLELATVVAGPPLWGAERREPQPAKLLEDVARVSRVDHAAEPDAAAAANNVQEDRNNTRVISRPTQTNKERCPRKAASCH